MFNLFAKRNRKPVVQPKDKIDLIIEDIHASYDRADKSWESFNDGLATVRRQLEDQGYLPANSEKMGAEGRAKMTEDALYIRDCLQKARERDNG